MNPDLEGVIPVLMPSQFLQTVVNKIAENRYGIRVNLVLDYAKTNSDLPYSKVENISEFVTTISGKFGSPGVARNEGLGRVQSKYVFFWDVDDEPNLDAIVSLVNEMRSSEADIGIGNWSFLKEADNVKGTDVISVAMSPGIWRFIFRREFIDGLNFSDLKWGEDQLFIAEVLSREPKIVTSQEIVYSYRKDVPGSLTSNHSHVKDIFSSLRKITGLADNSPGKFGLCLEIMLFKQLITIFKYGGLTLGLRATLVLFRTHKTNALVRNLIQLITVDTRRWN